MHRLLIQVVFWLGLCVFTGFSPAQSFDLAINSSALLPEYFVAVDKSEQTLYVLEHKSPLQIVKQVPCSTGQNKGNKYIEGDKKTPEGIYFLERKLSISYKKELYGDLAYVLNYPNPVNLLEGKTGYGIWLHGRGKPLVPRDTQGCIALNTEQLVSLGPYILTQETPILIAQDLTFTDQPMNQVSELKQQVSSWAAAWQEKSDRFFQYYAPKAFSKASEKDFQSFMAHKRDLFRRYAWIDVFIQDIKVVPGPDYWVTFFKQYFRSPEYTAQGYKRLYWQKHNQEWKIIGKEWRSRELDLRESYVRAAERAIGSWLKDWIAAWEEADLEAYADFYARNCRQNQRQGLENIVQYKHTVWQEEMPEQVNVADLQVTMHEAGFKVSFEQDYRGRQGYHDRGIKTLLLRPEAGKYTILREKWEPSPQS